MAFLYLEKRSREASFGLNEKANNDKLNDRFYRIRQIQTMRSEFRIISYFAKWLESIEKQDGFPSC